LDTLVCEESRGRVPWLFPLESSRKKDNVNFFLKYVFRALNIREEEKDMCM